MKEMTFKSTPKLHFDEFWSSNPQTAASPSSDYIFVDQLLNFSNEEEEEEEEEAEAKNNHSSVPAPLQLQQHHDSDQNSNHSFTNSSEDDFWSNSSRDFEDLEWLSHLVADSTQEEYSAAPPAYSVFLTEKPSNSQKETTHHVHPLPSFEHILNTPFPSKPRSKRAKISGRVWSLTNLFSSPPLHSPPAKKPKKNPAEEGAGRVQTPRRCSHCGVQKTPQWRAGPLGAKSLCNACGVRFKSGRLFPEYRPACSPTFSSELHSNHHRKVLEMRRKKETEKPHSGLELV
ncbi:GATA transcription factor 7-like [Benincasa hispida]|uniref:GATA transcription factor 7-like n=1 Tax=Benincasa hispida TaxID=102211 RepID=UPI0019004157|nr:GATA transcription factor 7-like [Benincasa hispida]